MMSWIRAFGAAVFMLTTIGFIHWLLPHWWVIFIAWLIFYVVTRLLWTYEEDKDRIAKIFE